MIVDLLSKIFNLPVGKLFRDTYGAQATQLGNLRTTVVANAASYSGLHSHYGVAAQTKLSIEEEKQCESLLPVLAGYAQVFEIDELGNDHGAMLSQTLQKVIKNYGALVRMYASAFEAYAESSKDLRALVGGGTGGTSASTTSTTTSAP
jgi:sigma54-dependent transcription regulator